MGDEHLDVVVRGGVITAMAPLPDGRIYIGGHLLSVQGVPQRAVARLLPEGRLDPSFDPETTSEDCTPNLFVQEDGRLVANGGWSWGSAGQRFLPDGSRDPSFAALPSATEILALLPGGGFLATTGRLTQDGLSDPTFHTSLDLRNAGPALVHPDGRILLVYWDGEAIRLIRLLPMGTLDPAFDPAGALVFRGGSIQSLAALPDGMYFVGGSFTSIGGLTRTHLARVTATGAVDPSFDARDAFLYTATGGVFGWLGDEVLALAPLQDGRILVGGRFLNPSSASDHGVVRVNSDGSLDRTFQFGDGPSGPARESERASGFRDTVLINQIAVQSNGHILLTGDFVRFSGFRRMGIVRLVREPPALALSFPRRLPNGGVELDVTGPPGLSGTVQSATNLEAPDWQSFVTFSLSEGSYIVRDPAVPDGGRRFYRARAE